MTVVEGVRCGLSLEDRLFAADILPLPRNDDSRQLYRNDGGRAGLMPRQHKEQKHSDFQDRDRPIRPDEDTRPLADRVPARILEERANASPNRQFVSFRGDWFTYGEMDRRANRVAHALTLNGTGKGDRVAIMLDNRLEYFDLWFGASRVGAIQLPISVDYKSRQIAQTFQRSRVDLVVVDSCYLPELEAAFELTGVRIATIVLDQTQEQSAREDTVSYEQWIANALSEPIANSDQVSGADISAVMNTSGTTGQPKGVLLTHAQQYILGRNIAADMRLSSDDVLYNFFPLFHNTSQAMITVPVILAGASMVLVERFSASRFWQDVEEHGCTAFCYIGEIINILLKGFEADQSNNSTLRVGWGIGASADDTVAFTSRFGIELRCGYGSTEANIPTCMPPQTAKPGSAGCVLPGFEIRIADQTGQPLPKGQVGEILVRSSEPYALMAGYDADPEATAKAWSDLWLHTGDAGRFDKDDFLYFEGRIKDVIRVRGENVPAQDVEAVMLEEPAVLESAAIAVPCDLGGDDLKVVVVLKGGFDLSPETLFDRAARVLPKYAVPRYIEFVEAMPKTPTNKIKKHELRKTPFTETTWDRLKKKSD